MGTEQQHFGFSRTEDNKSCWHLCVICPALEKYVIFTNLTKWKHLHWSWCADEMYMFEKGKNQKVSTNTLSGPDLYLIIHPCSSAPKST